MAKKTLEWVIIILAVAWYGLTILNGLYEEVEEKEYSTETKEIL